MPSSNLILPAFIRVCLPVILLVMAVSACDSDYIIRDAAQQYVVEGWIDNGAAPVVILTKSMPIDDHFHTEEDVMDLLVTDANVRVVCDADTIPLEATMSTTYFPPIIYTNPRLHGEVGKTYHLLIDTQDGQHLSAVTTIPEPVALDDIYAEPVATSDTLFQIVLTFHDNHLQHNYYKLFTRVSNPRFAQNSGGFYGSYYKDSFLSPIISCFDDRTLTENPKFCITRGFMNYVNDTDIYYLRGDEVEVKFAQIDEQSFRFWEEQQNQMLFGTNYMFHGTRNNMTTITGGLGSWCGYGATFYKLDI